MRAEEQKRPEELHEWRPIPDPTTRTTEQLYREIQTLKELLDARLKGNEREIRLLQEHIGQLPSIEAIAESVKALQLIAVHEEKFRSVGLQFIERDTRIEQTNRDAKSAFEAALRTAKEASWEQNKSSTIASAKSDAAMTKQLDQIGITIQAMERGQSEKIDDLKSRIGTIEAIKQGGKEQKEGLSTTMAIIGAIIAILVNAATIMMALGKIKSAP